MLVLSSFVGNDLEGVSPVPRPPVCESLPRVLGLLVPVPYIPACWITELNFFAVIGKNVFNQVFPFVAFRHGKVVDRSPSDPEDPFS